MQTCKQTSKHGAWVQNPIARFCESLFSLVCYLKPQVKGKTRKRYYLKPQRKPITSSYHVIITSTAHHEDNKNGYYPKPVKTHQHIINITSHQKVQVCYHKLICKVEFNQPSYWLYSVSNLLVFQHLVTLYLGGFVVRVVSEIEC